jgi:hypothetical protein
MSLQGYSYGVLLFMTITTKCIVVLIKMYDTYFIGDALRCTLNVNKTELKVINNCVGVVLVVEEDTWV